MLDQMPGVSIMSAPHRRQILASTGKLIVGSRASMCETCKSTGEVTCLSSATTLSIDGPAE